MDAADLMFAGPVRQAELVRDGEVTPRELVDAALERIERLDGRLNAFRVVMAEEARAAADALRPGDGARPLLGVPVAIKDEMEVAGQTTQHGTAARRPPEPADSRIVQRLREAGAIVVGKTNVSELTIWPYTETEAFGVTRNPWSPERTPGGSSGGSAAAVAAGMVGLATAGDGLGSIRIPAACCGLFGLKPQRDRVSTAPREGAWYGMTHYGVLTRSVRDTAAALDVLAERPPDEPFAAAAGRPPGRLRVAFSLRRPPFIGSRVDGELRAAIDATLELLRALGHEVVERRVPYEPSGTVAAILRWQRGIHDEAVALDSVDLLERASRGMVRRGALVWPRVARASWAADGRRAARMDRVFDDADVLLTPVTTGPAQPAGRLAGTGTTKAIFRSSNWAPYPGPWNLTGHPACSVPAGWTADGLPLAVQLVARTGAEATLLALAAQMESERPWTDRRPPSS